MNDGEQKSIFSWPWEKPSRNRTPAPVRPEGPIIKASSYELTELTGDEVWLTHDFSDEFKKRMRVFGLDGTRHDNLRFEQVFVLVSKNDDVRFHMQLHWGLIRTIDSPDVYLRFEDKYGVPAEWHLGNPSRACEAVGREPWQHGTLVDGSYKTAKIFLRHTDCRWRYCT
nr:hypothetical protein [uncultured Shimia sp.]